MMFKALQQNVFGSPKDDDLMSVINTAEDWTSFRYLQSFVRTDVWTVRLESSGDYIRVGSNLIHQERYVGLHYFQGTSGILDITVKTSGSSGSWPKEWGVF